MKNLTASSFGITRMTSDEFLAYLKKYGSLYGNSTSDCFWIRTLPHDPFDGLPEFGFLDPDDFKSLQIDLSDEVLPGTESNHISIEAYNAFASCDEWHGGYVEGFGYIDVAASSLYGNSLYLGNSWYACGTPQNPVRVAKFYKLSLEGRWKGGYVDTSWGYVSENTHILGCSTETLTQVDEGEVTLGTLINVRSSLSRGLSTIDSMRQQFKDFWDEARNSYEIDDKTLGEYIRQNFYYAQTDDVKEGLAEHKTVLMRQVTRTTDDNFGIRKYGYDVMVVGYSAVKNEYECIEPTGPSVISISELDIQREGIEIQTHVLSKS